MSSFIDPFLHTVLVLLLFFKVLVLDLVRVSGLVCKVFCSSFSGLSVSAS